MMISLLADATASAAQVSGGMSLISSEFITALFTGMAAVVGVIWQRSANKRALEKKDEEIKRIKAEIPQPLSVEQTAYQAKMKENEKDHENLFCRVSKIEQDVARIEAKSDANAISIQRQLDSLTNMVSQLFERIVKGKK